MDFRFWILDFGFSRLIMLFVMSFLLLTVSAQEGENYSADKKTTTAVVTAERNISTDAGQFNLRLSRAPSDPRTGETTQFLIRLSEKIEGGFGASEPAPLENVMVTATITTANGEKVAENLSTKTEPGGNYRLNYVFEQAGNHTIALAATTSDKRFFSADFPVTISTARVNWTFWIGLMILSLLSIGIIGGAVSIVGRGANAGTRARQIVPFGVAALIFFAFGTLALAYFQPPSQPRSIAELSANAAAAPANETAANSSTALATVGRLTVSKESQLLFGIKTEIVAARQITSGLKTTGIVRARPEARAVVVPPVSGRIVLRSNLGLGSAVARGEQIGTVEQVLDVSGQTELESQRLEVIAQNREIEAKKLEIKNNVLALQRQQNEQRDTLQQAQAKLAQALRELRRAENLVEANAVPRKRVEEARTAVRVAESETAGAERQIKNIADQIKATNAGQNIFTAPDIRQPSRIFPLTAPVTGVIGEIKATSGSQIEIGTEILTIVNLSTVLLEANVFERDLSIVRESTRASFTTAALSGEVYRIGEADGDGKLVSIGQTVNPESRTVPVIYEIKNPLQRLRDGNFVEITIDTSGDRQVVAVPKKAIVNEQGQTFVFVFTGGESFERRLVGLGAEGADYYEVNSGLQTGERIVTEGVYQLRSTQFAN